MSEKKDPAVEHASRKHAVLSVLKATAGIYFFYFLYGLELEKMVTKRYGVLDERFSQKPFLMFAQCMFHVVAAVILLPFQNILTPPKKGRSYSSLSLSALLKFAKPSFFVFGAMLSSTWALNYCPYPTQVVAKSSKSIPVIIAKAFFFKTPYSRMQYACVFAICAGISAFMLFKPSTKAVTSEIALEPLGAALLLLSLLFDGFSGAYQDHTGSAAKPSPIASMLYNNVWSTVYSFAMILASGQLYDSFGFVARNPEVLIDLLTFSLCSAGGQVFIHYVIVSHSSLACALITTTRKFFSVILSVVYFGHHLAPAQWACALMVFACIFVLEKESSSVKSHEIKSKTEHIVVPSRVKPKQS
eukprot:ANDGO_01091.mRNA.1 Solute carrier family 35 member B1 homolog